MFRTISKIVTKAQEIVLGQEFLQQESLRYQHIQWAGDYWTTQYILGRPEGEILEDPLLQETLDGLNDEEAI